MNRDIDSILGTMTEAFLSRLGDRVELIFRFGSTIRGNARPGSDIDICWIPSSEEDWQCMTVEVGGVLIDLFALHWSQLSAMAEFDDPRGLLLEHNLVLYAKDEAARERFSSLAERHRALQAPGQRKRMQEKAMDLFQKAAYPLYLLERASSRGELLDAIDAGHRLLGDLSHCLMVLNQKAVDTRRESDLSSLPRLPADFLRLRAELSAGRDCATLAASGRELMEAVRSQLLAEQAELCREEADFIRNAGSGGCAEEANGLRHAARSAAERDPAAFSREACSILRELRFHVGQGFTGRWFHDFNALSELSPELPGLELGALQAAVERLDYAQAAELSLAMEADLKALYRSKGAPTNCFRDRAELSAWIGKEWKP